VFAHVKKSSNAETSKFSEPILWLRGIHRLPSESAALPPCTVARHYRA